MDEKKPSLAAIILGGKKPEDEKEEVTPSKMGADSAIDDMWDAFMAKDKEMFSKSFKTAVEMCSKYSDDDK